MFIARLMGIIYSPSILRHLMVFGGCGKLYLGNHSVAVVCSVEMLLVVGCGDDSSSEHVIGGL
jgi:hypothetical protein